MAVRVFGQSLVEIVFEVSVCDQLFVESGPEIDFENDLVRRIEVTEDNYHLLLVGTSQR